jgi:hypothetical protein
MNLEKRFSGLIINRSKCLNQSWQTIVAIDFGISEEGIYSCRLRFKYGKEFKSFNLKNDDIIVMNDDYNELVDVTSVSNLSMNMLSTRNQSIKVYLNLEHELLLNVGDVNIYQNRNRVKRLNLQEICYTIWGFDGFLMYCYVECSNMPYLRSIIRDLTCEIFSHVKNEVINVSMYGILKALNRIGRLNYFCDNDRRKYLFDLLRIFYANKKYSNDVSRKKAAEDVTKLSSGVSVDRIDKEANIKSDLKRFNELKDWLNAGGSFQLGRDKNGNLRVYVCDELKIYRNDINLMFEMLFSRTLRYQFIINNRNNNLCLFVDYDRSSYLQSYCTTLEFVENMYLSSQDIALDWNSEFLCRRISSVILSRENVIRKMFSFIHINGKVINRLTSAGIVLSDIIDKKNNCLDYSKVKNLSEMKRNIVIVKLCDALPDIFSVGMIFEFKGAIISSLDCRPWMLSGDVIDYLNYYGVFKGNGCNSDECFVILNCLPRVLRRIYGCGSNEMENLKLVLERLRKAILLRIENLPSEYDAMIANGYDGDIIQSEIGNVHDMIGRVYAQMIIISLCYNKYVINSSVKEKN